MRILGAARNGGGTGHHGRRDQQHERCPIFIADKKGYFREEGLEVKVVNFRSAADMVAPLGAGQLEAGAGSASAGLYNAVARGIRIKIVADKGVVSARLRRHQDFSAQGSCRQRTLQVAQGSQGHEVRHERARVSNTSTLNTLLKSVG
jgi:NitT/TauT family transport system substrate-binding protein